MRWIAILPILLLAGCSAAEREPFDAVVTFSLPAAEGDAAATTQQATVFLVVEKAGRKPIVDAWPDDVGEDVRYGRHKFPLYCTAASIAGYYGPILANAGWKKTDYRVEGARVHFFGVTRLNSGASGTEIQVTVDRVPD